MNDRRIDFEVKRVNAIRAQLLAEDHTIDEITLADTIEGVSDLNEMLARIVRHALKDKRRTDEIEMQMSELELLRDRYKARADKRRKIVADAMAEADISKITAPEFTASLRSNAPHVIVIDENLIPPEFFEMRPHLLKRELGEAMKGGAQVAGAALSNPGLSLAVRTK